MKKNITFTIFFIFISLVSTQLQAQYIWHDYPYGGDNESYARADSFKNRFKIPKHYAAINFETLAGMKYVEENDKIISYKAIGAAYNQMQQECPKCFIIGR